MTATASEAIAAHLATLAARRDHFSDSAGTSHRSVMVPESWHPLADAITDGELEAFLSDFKTIVGATAAKLPTHEQFIAARCAAQPVKFQRIPA